MTLCSRLLPLKMIIRRRRQVAFVACVVLWLSVLSSLEYIITAVVLGQWTSRSDVDRPAGPVVAVTGAPGTMAESRRRRTLGMAMPSIDYEAFKRLEVSQAGPSDPEVIRVAREAMTPPVDRLKIRTPRKTAQAAIVDKVLLNKTGGFFVECGAFDGETASNTMFLEHSRKWSGLLIEMDPAFYTQLIGKRRRAWTINACLSNRQTVVEMKFFESNGQLGRLSMDNSTKRRQPPNSAFCFALETLLLALNQTHVDYFSLDVEGNELNVLRALPLDRLDIDVISAEFLHAREPVDEYKQLMRNHGYKFYASVQSMDFIFVKKRLLDARGGAAKVNKGTDVSRPPTAEIRPKRRSAEEVNVQEQKVPKGDAGNENINVIYT